uniref:Uncharacterized protein n=1 Tax=Amphimedon queenslandica TaxID=400682 RepID=A0A1X7TN01_AMPQE
MYPRYRLPRIFLCPQLLMTSPGLGCVLFQPESGAWLQALPVFSLGLRLDDTTVHIGVALRLGLSVCVPHTCRLCGASVDSLGLHGLTCKKGNRSFHRHDAVNEVVHRALSSAGISSTLEPSGLSCSDGKRHDGMTLIPWENGKPLLWDATVPDSLAVSYRSQAIAATGAVAAFAESRKMSKYTNLPQSLLFCPLAIESLGALGPRSRHLIHHLDRRIRHLMGEENSTSYLLQRLSVAVQRGNTSLIRDSLPLGPSLTLVADPAVTGSGSWQKLN